MIACALSVRGTATTDRTSKYKLIRRVPKKRYPAAAKLTMKNLVSSSLLCRSWYCRKPLPGGPRQLLCAASFKPGFPEENLPTVSSAFSKSHQHFLKTTCAATSSSKGAATVDPNNEERVTDVELYNEAADSYLAYAMSVIVGRALPDARDGLKPVHRRTLYSMHDLGLSSGKPFRKCARVVGEVLGKYHPHGDQAVYGSLVRMAQDFSMRDTLINGHGNFGSVDQDPAAAMRYTECKLKPLTEMALLADLGAETVPFVDTFDGAQQEPVVFPAVVPQLLVNGSTGIAVGMSTSIPPHNLHEVVECMCKLVDEPDATVAELVKYVRAPDFPTGGQILDADNEIIKLYSTGKGRVTLRGVAGVESRGKDKESIIITEIPYMTSKAALVEKIAELAGSKVLDGISAVRDESDRTGMRVVVELKRGAPAQVLLNNLYKHTNLQKRIGYNMLALVDNQPLTLSLPEILKTFIDFREEVIRKRSLFYLNKAEARDHIVQGLLSALESLEVVVDTIKDSQDSQEAASRLGEELGLSAKQTEAVLGMPLRRLTGLEKGKLEAEHSELQSTISDLQSLLANPQRVKDLLKEEARAVASKFGTKRRSQVLGEEGGDIDDEALVPNTENLVVLSEQGYIKRMPPSTFSSQSRGTRGKSGGRLREHDTLMKMVHCRSLDQVLFFSESGIVYSMKAFQIPEGSRQSSGTPLAQLGIPQDEITAMMTLDSDSEVGEQDYLVMLTVNGQIKKTHLSAYKNVRSSGIVAIKLGEDDRLRWVVRCHSNTSALLVSSAAKAIRIKLDDKHLRGTGRATLGVQAMSIQPNEHMVGMAVIDEDDIAEQSEVEEESGDERSDEEMDADPAQRCLLLITQQGKGKRVPLRLFKTQRRAGKGVICYKLDEGDSLAAVQVVGQLEDDKEQMVCVGSLNGKVNRLSVDSISVQSRATKGVVVQKLEEGDVVKTVALMESDSS